MPNKFNPMWQTDRQRSREEEGIGIGIREERGNFFDFVSAKNVIPFRFGVFMIEFALPEIVSSFNTRRKQQEVCLQLYSHTHSLNGMNMCVHNYEPTCVCHVCCCSCSYLHKKETCLLRVRCLISACHGMTSHAGRSCPIWFCLAALGLSAPPNCWFHHSNFYFSNVICIFFSGECPGGNFLDPISA